MFKYLQSRIRGTASTGPGEPPAGLVSFYWHFVRQTKGWYALMFITSLAVALIDTVIPVFIGKLVSLMEAVDRQAALDAQWPLLAGMMAYVPLAAPHNMVDIDLDRRSVPVAAVKDVPDDIMGNELMRPVVKADGKLGLRRPRTHRAAAIAAEQDGFRG